MKEKVKIFLESDILEKYLLGDTTKEESQKAERYIAMYPEVRETYDTLQKNLETFANLYARKTPEGLKEIILASARKETMVSKRFMRYAVAASIAIMIFAGSSLFFWNQNQTLQQENTMVTNQIKYLEDNMKDQLADMRNQFIVLNNPATKKYQVKGEREEKELKGIDYIHPVKKISYINVRNVPELPENKCFKLCAELNG